MKQLYEKNKKLFVGIAVFLCVAVIAGVGAGVWHFAGQSSDSAQAKETKQAVSTYRAEEKEEKKEVKKEEQDEEPVDVISEEAVEAQEVTQEAAEVVEDSVLDIVETQAPQAPQAAPVAEAPAQAPAAEAPAGAAPATDLSNMAQNVPFPYEIHVNKQMNCVTVYAMDTNGVYSIPCRAMVCSTGNATPLGTFQTPAKYVWKVLKGGVWGQYSTRVTGSILFHSVPYRTSSKDALISKYYNKLGTTASAGCIRLTTIDAKWIYDNCPLGTTVIIYNDSNPGPLGKPTAMKVSESNKWDPTDPDPANPWHGHVLRIEGVQNQAIERGTGFDAMAGVVATDASGNNVTGSVQVSTNANVNESGIYGIHYVVTDSLGNMATADATLTVVDTQAPVFAGIPSRIDGKRYWEVTRELLLSGVTVTDNGLGFSNDCVEVQIPAIVDGENAITYRATDSSGNTSYASTVVVCDSTAPVISRKSGMSSYISCSQAMDANIAMGRIDIQDRSPVNASCQLTPLEWGYQLDYTATDSYGNVSYFTDTVSYMNYEFEETSAGITGSNWTEGMCLKDSEGHTMEVTSDMVVQALDNGDGTYAVLYRYTYNSPLGSRTAQYERTVTAQK